MSEHDEKRERPAEPAEPFWPNTPEGRAYMIEFVDKMIGSVERLAETARAANRMTLHTNREIHQEERRERREHARPITVTVDANRLQDLVLVLEDGLDALKESLSQVSAQVAWMHTDLVRVRRWLRVVIAAGEKQTDTEPEGIQG